MDLPSWIETLQDLTPPSQTSVPLQALWWAAKGDWDRAHTLAQEDTSSEASWVHGYLHRVEGDLGNATYWYRRAGKQVATGPLDVEWEEISVELLDVLP